MAANSQVDAKITPADRSVIVKVRGRQGAMTSFVESCLETTAGSAVAVERGARHRPRAKRLIRLLADKSNILVTTHEQPDPDALASSFALAELLRMKLKDAKITVSVKGSIGGGYNAAFLKQCGASPEPWDERGLKHFDAIVLLDVQPQSKLSPLEEAGVVPTAVIDHHRARGRRPGCEFCDIRTDVGASCSIIFSYFMELEADITPELAAMLLFAIETDLAGAAGQPGELDNMALSSLTLLADMRKLYKMRYADLPQGIYEAHAAGLANAIFYSEALITHLEKIQSPEVPAVIADFLLRFELVQWVLVTARNGSSLALSLRMGSSKGSAADIMRRLVRELGEGGGHRTKAGGSIPLETGSAAEVEKIRGILRRRLLRSLHITGARGQKLVPAQEET